MGSRVEVEQAKICDDTGDAACVVISGKCQALTVLRPDREQHEAEIVVALVIIVLFASLGARAATDRAPPSGRWPASRSERST